MMSERDAADAAVVRAIREAVREVEELIDHVRKVAVSATRIAARIGLHSERQNKRP